ncbi:excinuclease ABC subunit UvrC [Merdimmobilis hominis]|uniref:excinuclease ABC subunit UvrC n=1 Tax=Merdimmobilis hominis TaxID=2897707 RepID=UPI0009403B59|nr:excinuclease ABC subunit UvrC [Merdimmobilis hominis]
MTDEILARLKKRVKNLPMQPGVYIMKDKSGNIIYIGKAKSLKNRVSSYFRSIDKHLPKVYQMVQHVDDFEYIVTDSEFEALVLECSLIKYHTPKYNILLKDDKGYTYIKITNEEYPRIESAKQRLDDGATYIGPYISGFVVKQTVDEANRVFALPSCSRKFPQEFGKGRPCLNFHMRRCMGLCQGKISKEEYAETLSQAMDFIKGGGNATLKILEKKMEEAAENLEFEKAAHYRDRIKAIQKINEQQKVVYAKAVNQDVHAFVQGSGDTCAVVLKFREERLVDKQDFFLGEVDSLPEARSEFLVRYYSGNSDIPPLIEIDDQYEDPELVEEYIAQQAGKKVTLHIPQRGEQHKLVQMAITNAAQQISHLTEQSGRDVAALAELAKLLGLKKPPRYIEAYDISNIGSDTVVAGMVVFEGGKPLKSAYKRFSIKTVNGIDDYGSMREVITRRMKRYEEEKESGVSFGRLPDLILLDGGKGHVSAVAPVLAQFGVEIPLFGMVKDDRHRTRAIALDGGEIAIGSQRGAFTLISTIQEEVHRFAISYSRQKHQKAGLELALTTVEGIGPTRAKALFQYFKTKKAMTEATVEQLCQVKGISRQKAQAVYEYLHPELFPQEEEEIAEDGE